MCFKMNLLKSLSSSEPSCASSIPYIKRLLPPLNPPLSPPLNPPLNPPLSPPLNPPLSPPLKPPPLPPRGAKLPPPPLEGAEVVPLGLGKNLRGNIFMERVLVPVHGQTVVFVHVYLLSFFEGRGNHSF